MKERAINLIKAGFPYFYVETYEPERVSPILREISKELNYQIEDWDFETSSNPMGPFEKEFGQSRTIWNLKNLNWFLRIPDSSGFDNFMVQYLQNHYSDFVGSDRKALFIVSITPFDQAIPEPLQRLFTPLKLELPNDKAIEKIVEEVSKSVPSLIIKNKRDIVNNLKGMTEIEAANAFSFAIVKGKGKPDPKEIAKLRAKEIEKSPGLRIHEPDNNIQILGYENLSEFVLKGINHELGKGVLLVGPPGTGKTSFCKYVAGKSNKILFELEIAQLMGNGLVGQAEKSMARALSIVKANAPALLLVDEIDKSLSGASGGSTDGGTTARSMSQFLKFLSDDRPKGVYIIATCNNISALPPEWLRAERWDSAPFFVDLPNEKERQEIFSYYLTEFDVEDRTGFSPDMKGWSGAEIKSLCRIAKMNNYTLERANDFIIPISETMRENFVKLQELKSKTIPASIVKKKRENKRSVQI